MHRYSPYTRRPAFAYSVGYSPSHAPGYIQPFTYSAGNSFVANLPAPIPQNPPPETIATVPKPARPLDWTPSAAALSYEGKIYAVLQIIKDDLNLSLMDFLLRVIGTKSDELFDHFKTGFYSSDGISHFLNTAERIPKGLSKLTEWLRSYGADILTTEMEKEVDCIKNDFSIGVDDFSLEVLLGFDVESSVTAVLKEKAPIFWNFLVKSSHSARALKENTVKTPDLVRFHVTYMS